MSETTLASVQRRVHGMHELWLEAADTMEAEHVNHHERPSVLPIAFSVNHMTRTEDQIVNRLFGGRPPIWQIGDWAAKTGVTIDDLGKELPVSDAEKIRIGDWDAYRSYQREVFSATEDWLGSFDASRLSEVLFGGIVPPVFQKAYVARVVGNGPITMLDGIECWIFQHGIRHLGECEHARALVGLGGMTS